MIDEKEAQIYYEIAEQTYNEARDIIKDAAASVYNSDSTADQSLFDALMLSFDLLTQGFLLMTATQDGWYLSSERKIIDGLFDHTLLKSFIQNKGIPLSIEDIPVLCKSETPKAKELLKQLILALTDSFALFFVLVGAALKKDYCELLTGKILLICASLACSDTGVPDLTKCSGEMLTTQNELMGATAYMKEIVVPRWREVEAQVVAMCQITPSQAQATTEAAQPTQNVELHTQTAPQRQSGPDSAQGSFAPKSLISKLNVNSASLLNCKDGYFSGYDECIVYIEAHGCTATGCIVTQDGYFVTCASVVEDYDELDVKVVWDVAIDTIVDEYKSRVVTLDEETNLAVCKIDGYNGKYAEVELTQAEDKVGETIVLCEIADDGIEATPTVNFTIGCIFYGDSSDRLDVCSESDNLCSPVVSYDTGKVIGFSCKGLDVDFDDEDFDENSDEIEITNYFIPAYFLRRLKI